LSWKLTKQILETVKEEIRVQRVKYYSERLDKNSTDARKYWESINEARGKGGGQAMGQIRIANEVISVQENPELVADRFNKFYIVVQSF